MDEEVVVIDESDESTETDGDLGPMVDRSGVVARWLDNSIAGGVTNEPGDIAGVANGWAETGDVGSTRPLWLTAGGRCGMADVFVGGDGATNG